MLRRWLALSAFPLLLGAVVPGTFAQPAPPTQPWVTAELLSDHATPGLIGWEVLDLRAEDDRLAVLTRTGLSLLQHADGTWHNTAKVAIEQPLRLFLTHGLAVVTTASEVLVFQPDGTLTHTLPGLIAHPNNQILLGELPGTGKRALLVAGWRTHVLDLTTGQAQQVAGVNLKNLRGVMQLDRAHDQLLAATREGLFTWDAEGSTFAPWLDAGNQPLVPGADVNALSLHPEKPLLYLGTHGNSLWAIDLNHRQSHHLTAESVAGWPAGKHVYRVTVDPRRDLLHVPLWDTVRIFSPASDPARLTQIGELTTTSEPAVYSNRDVGPRGQGAAYLPETDHLLVATQWGVTVLGSDTSAPFLTDSGLDGFVQRAADLPGQGPLYDTLRREKFRGTWTSASVGLSEAVLDQFRQAQINAVLYQIFYYGHAEFYGSNVLHTEQLKRLAKQAHERGILFFPSARPFGWSSMNHSGVRDYDYRPMILRSGETGRYTQPPRLPAWTRSHFPCPRDRGYWERSIFPHFEELAELAQEVPIAGFFYELGDSYSGSNIRFPQDEACLCDDCWQHYWQERGGATAEQLVLPAENSQRYRALTQAQRWEDYKTWLQSEVAALARESLEKARAIAPNFTAHLCLPETSARYEEVWFYNAFIDGFGSAQHPTLVLSQQTYGAAFTPSMAVYPGQHMAQRGQHAIFVPGLGTLWYSPDQVAHHAPERHRATAGTWYYEGHSWERGPETNYYRPLHRQTGGPFTVQQYIEALSGVTFE